MKNFNTTEFIAKKAGYDGKIVPIENLQNDATSAKNGYVLYHDGEAKKCFQCGNTHHKGYILGENAPRSLPSIMIPVSSNISYEFADINSTFMCEHCGWLNTYYGSQKITLDKDYVPAEDEEGLNFNEKKGVWRKEVGKRILNALIDENGIHRKEFGSTAANELYDILRNPPKPPFFILINSGGTVLENMAFYALPSVSAGCVVVTYGLKNMVVSPKKVFEALDDSARIAEKYNSALVDAKIKEKALRLTGGEDLFWNRQGEEAGYVVSRAPYYRFEWFAKELSDFILKYSRDTRVVAKMILLRHQTELKKLTKTQGE